MGLGSMKTYISASFIALALTACASSAPKDRDLRDPAPEPWSGWDTSNYPDENAPATASLWATSPDALLSMRRAKEVGDLLTVVVEMDDQASVQSSLSRSRDSSEGLNIGALFGLPDAAGAVLPNGASLSPGVDFDRNSNLNGSGAVNRAEQVAFTLAARVVDLEPNGNLIISGYQQTRISNEVRYLTVSGVIRAQDITRTNTVTYEKIADARLSYISEGDTTAQGGRRAIPRVLDRVLPF